MAPVASVKYGDEVCTAQEVQSSCYYLSDHPLLDPAIYMFPGLFGKSLIDEKDIMSSGGQFGDWALLGFISVVILVGELSFCQR